MAFRLMIYPFPCPPRPPASRISGPNFLADDTNIWRTSDSRASSTNREAGELRVLAL